MKIGYLVHDLADDAVRRRVRMLRSCADVTLLGFRRTEASVPSVAGLTPIDLGRTMDARLAHRTAAVLRAAAGIRRWEKHLSDCTVIVARQLEMLALAALARSRVAPDAPLVFECLDIHRLMLSNRLAGTGLRALEKRLLGSCSLLIVSSPAFIARHFARYGAVLPPQLLLENKVLAEDLPPEALERMASIRGTAPPPGLPWRIGWFGVIRCRRSLQILTRLARRLPDLIEVIIRGRPRRNVIPDFDAMIAAAPNVSFLGPYDRHTDLAAIYGGVHFTWAIDFYETGANSDWLLPNRLYEGSLYGAVPLALDSVETGRWLQARDCGVLLQQAPRQNLEDGLYQYFSRLDAPAYAAARSALARIPLPALLDDSAACNRLCGRLAALSRRSSP